MVPLEIGKIRLHNQLIADNRYTKPEEVVSWMLAMQAQDYTGAKWAVGLRLPVATDDDIEKAIRERLIIRSWPMRGTLHFVSAHDIRWMLALLAPRVIASSAGRYRQLELDEKVFTRTRKILTKILEGKKEINRQSLFQVLESSKIACKNQRGIHILQRHALEGLICFGSHQGKQPTFTLLDEWLPQTRKLEREEAMAELARRYFSSHGPATINDFIWWSGLTSKAAKEAVGLAQPVIVSEKIDDIVYFYNPAATALPNTSPAAYLLPSFDEFVLGYTDRSAVIEEKFVKLLTPGGGLFYPAIVLDGRISGVWKRNVKGNKVDLIIHPFKKLNSDQKSMLKRTSERYINFLTKMRSTPNVIHNSVPDIL